MNTSAAIANVRARGAGPEARGDQKECLSSRLVPLAWFLCDFATNRHESRGLVPQHTGKDLAGLIGHGAGDIQVGDGTEAGAAEGVDQEPLLL